MRDQQVNSFVGSIEVLTKNKGGNEAGCSQEEGPKKGFVMGSRTQGVQEILENIYRMSSPPQA